MNEHEGKSDLSEWPILHIGVRIEEINPVHTRLNIFTGEAHPDNDVPLEALTRGLSGQLVINNRVLIAVIERLNPVKLTYAEGVTLRIPQLEKYERATEVKGVGQWPK